MSTYRDVRLNLVAVKFHIITNYSNGTIYQNKSEQFLELPLHVTNIIKPVSHFY